MEKTKELFALGKNSVVQTLFGLFNFMGGACNLAYSTILSLFRPPFYFKLLVEQCYALGVLSLSITMITAISTGMVMSLQFGFGLERFGGKLYVPKVVGLSIMRELGPVLTCLMIAGRAGAGIAAEIASMKVTQQIDAIRALGTDPLKRIVIPRVLALLLTTPLLTVLADLVGISSGMLISSVELNIHPEFYFHEALASLRLSDFMVGFGKSVIFSLIIAFTGCYYGLNTSGGTQGVGKSTTQAVVTSSILITISDFILTKLFWFFEKGFGP